MGERFDWFVFIFRFQPCASASWRYSLLSQPSWPKAMEREDRPDGMGRAVVAAGEEGDHAERGKWLGRLLLTPSRGGSVNQRVKLGCWLAGG